jgi:hypothetical protein
MLLLAHAVKGCRMIHSKLLCLSANEDISTHTVMAQIHIPPYTPYFLILIPILIIDLCDRVLIHHDIIEGFCLYLCSCTCEVV